MIFLNYNKSWAAVNLGFLFLIYVVSTLAAGFITKDDHVNATLKKQYGYTSPKFTTYDKFGVVTGILSLVYISSTSILALKYLWKGL